MTMPDSRATGSGETVPVLHQGDDEWSPRDCAHPDCDGWRMHSVRSFHATNGTWMPECPLCGPLPVVGASSTSAGARAMALDHNYNERCDGRCVAWFEEDENAA